MLILGSTTDKIEMVLGGAVSANQLHFNASFRDIAFTPSEAFLPGRSVGQSNNTTDAVVVAAPGANTYRVIDYISIYNTDTASATVTVKYDANGTEGILWKGVVASTQVLQFTDGSGFELLTLGGSGNEFILDKISPPSTPAADKMSFWTGDLAGKMFLFYKSPLGFNTPLQEGLWETAFAMWVPAAAAGVYLGTNGSNLGTAASVPPTTTNLYTAMRRSTFASVVTTANQQVGIRTEAQFYRGNAAGQGGFFFCCKFGLDNWTAGDRLFVGFSASTTAVVTVQPSTLANTLGFCIEAGDTAITFLHNDAAGTGVKETIAGQPALADSQGYIAYIYAKPNDSVVYFRLDDMLTGATIIDSSINTELPVYTTMLCGQVIMGNAANVVVADARIGVGRLYIQTIN
ncbi:MAG TPA: hypothetical protein PLJ00_16230 [Chitinophagales bacterium]|nr:hypothetical protein [Chitinophagales bacterium]